MEEKECRICCDRYTAGVVTTTSFSKSGGGQLTRTIPIPNPWIQDLVVKPFGEATVTVQDGHSATGNPYLFQGRRWDSEVSLYYFRNRILNPVLGRFLQRDPSGETASVGPYGFASERPVVLADPTGLAPCPVDPSLVPRPQEECPSGRWDATGRFTSYTLVAFGFLTTLPMEFRCQDKFLVGYIKWKCCCRGADGTPQPPCQPAMRPQRLYLRRVCKGIYSSYGLEVGLGAGTGPITVHVQGVFKGADLAIVEKGWFSGGAVGAVVGGGFAFWGEQIWGGGAGLMPSLTASVSIRMTSVIDVGICAWQWSTGPRPTCGFDLAPVQDGFEPQRPPQRVGG